MPSGSVPQFAPHHGFVDGSAAFEPMDPGRIAAARQRFAELVETHPDNAAIRVGLASAAALAFEISRCDRAPDAAALRLAEVHAREACRLSAGSAEAWATLGFVLERTGARGGAVKALARAVSLAPDDWRYQLRLAHASWGDARLNAARQTLALRPGCAEARWLAATVFVARGHLEEAAHEIDEGLAAAIHSVDQSLAGVHWLKGLLTLRRGREHESLEHLHREQALATSGYVRAREFGANAAYAAGVCHLRQGDLKAASLAFDDALVRVPRHAMAQAASAVIAATEGKILAALEGVEPYDRGHASPPSLDTVMAWAALRVAAGDTNGAGELVRTALAMAPPGDDGWALPVEPLLGVHRHGQAWAPVLEMLRARAR